MKVVIVGGVAGGASCAARLRRLDENARDPDGGARAVRLVRELRPAVPRRRRDREGVEPAGGERPEMFRGFFAVDVRTGLRSGDDLAEEEDGRTARRRHRRGHDRVATTSSCCRPARSRSARRCPASTCPASSRCGRCPTRARSASGSSAAPCSWPAWTSTRASRRCGRRRARSSSAAASSAWRAAENLVHRGLRRHARRDGRPGAGAARPGDGAAWCEDHLVRHGVRVGAQRRRGRVRAGRRRRARACARSPGKAYPADVVILALGVRPDTDARASGRPRRSANAAASASTTRCAPATPTSSPSAMPSR